MSTKTTQTEAQVRETVKAMTPVELMWEFRQLSKNSWFDLDADGRMWFCIVKDEMLHRMGE